MKRLLLSLTLLSPFLLTAGGGPTISSVGIVPRVTQGSTPTNNNRVICWFWLTINGLSANATYRYYPAMDTLNATATSNGAGVAILINKTTRTFRRSFNPSMTNPAGYDSLTADASGNFSGWFGVEPTNNGRYTPGALVYPKLMLNNGAGGSTVAYRLLAASFPIKVLSVGTTASSATQGSALYDSIGAAPKNFICIYDDPFANGSPTNIAIVESDTMSLTASTSTAAFYRNFVDSLPGHWGAIIPNDYPNGVRALVEHDFTTGMAIDTVSDMDGIWCYGTNTVNMTNGTTGLYLNSTFTLNISAMMPDTAWTGIPASFTGTSNSPNSTYTWDYGDLGSGNGASTTHTYIAPGIYNSELIVSTGGCSDTISQTVVVLLSTGIAAPMPLSFQLYPNPADGEFFITTRDNNQKLITVYNTLGEVVYAQEMTGNSLRINLDNLNNSIYLVRIQDKITGKSGTKRIVLQ